MFLGEMLFTILHHVVLGSLVSSARGDKQHVLYADRQMCMLRTWSLAKGNVEKQMLAW